MSQLPCESKSGSTSSRSSHSGSNPLSLKIAQILELRRQICLQQQYLTYRFEQDWSKTFESPDVVSGHDHNYTLDSDTDSNEPDVDIDDWCEPDCTFDSDGNYFDDGDEGDDDSDSSSESEGSKHESDNEIGSDSDKFIAPLSIYQKVSYKDFDFHRWLKEFDLVSAKEIFVFHGMQQKEMWTKNNFNSILSHPLIQKDKKLKSQIDTMLKTFCSSKLRYFTTKRVKECDGNDTNNNGNGNDIIYGNVNNNDTRINLKMHKMPPMPMNLQYHFM